MDCAGLATLSILHIDSDEFNIDNLDCPEVAFTIWTQLQYLTLIDVAFNDRPGKN